MPTFADLQRKIEQLEAGHDRRTWEVHFWRYDLNELHVNAQATIEMLLNGLSDEQLDAEFGKHPFDGRTLRSHLEAGLAKVNECNRYNERFTRAWEEKLTAVQYRYLYDPLTGEYARGLPPELEGVSS